MKYVQWFFAIILTGSGIVGMFTNPHIFANGVTMAAGIFILPPVIEHVSMPKWTMWLVLITGLAAWSSTQPKEAATGDTAKAEVVPVKSREEVVAGFFSPYDGSHPGLERAIEKSMNDPDSYDHEETRIRDNGATIYVFTKFRGKNAFGAVVVSYAEGTVNGTTGELIEWTFVEP